jgi:drug/metabolite transporter (DMT)-like permease
MSAASVLGEPPRDRTQLAVAALLAAGLMWGLTWIPMKHFAAQGLSGPMLTLTSYGAVGLLALPWLAWRRHTWWAHRLQVALIALSGGAANVCFVTALINGQVVRVMLLFYLAPIWGVLGGRIFLAEPFTRMRVAGVACAVLGAFLLLGGPAVLDTPPGWVDALAVASGMLYASQNIVTRAADGVTLDTKALVVFVGCGLLSALVVFLTGDVVPALSAPLMAQLLAFAGIWMLAAMLITAWGVTHLEAGRAAILLVFELVAATLSAMWIAGERLNGIEWMGAVLIVAAALLEALPPRNR